MKHWDFSPSDWLASHATEIDKYLGLRHLHASSDPLEFTKRWAAEVKLTPEAKRGNLMRSWQRKVERDAGLIMGIYRKEFPGPQPPQQYGNYDRTEMFVSWVTVMEWLQIEREREGAWNEYLKNGGAVQKNFLKDLKTYEKNSRIDRSMLVNLLRREAKLIRGPTRDMMYKSPWLGL
jgi:hypothetical protein